jgi:PAS domain-containing protein
MDELRTQPQDHLTAIARVAQYLAISIVHPEDRESFVEHQRLQHARIHEDDSEIQFRIIRRDGEVRWIARLCRPVFGPDEARLTVGQTHKPVTDLVAACERIIAREQGLQTGQQPRNAVMGYIRRQVS